MSEDRIDTAEQVSPDAGEVSMKKDWIDKAEQWSKIISAIVIPILLIFITRGIESVKDGIEQAKIFESLIDDLATDGNQIRKDIALITLDEISNEERSSLVVRIAEEIYNSTDFKDQKYLPVALDIIKKRDSERYKKILAAKEAADKERPDSFENNSVYLQYSDDFGQYAKTAEELISQYKKENITTDNPEKLEMSFPSNVRYFHEKDKKAAERIAGLTNQFLASKNIPLTLPVLDLSKHQGLSAREKLIEVWISFPHTSEQ
ncbi:hypothetical protein GM415_01750 [Pseudodesulfovibrio cashew]|uniref:Uncharacterized protein n=1 Tax=Pseudodesulfovibrio cashew TaxID=2678688 RepID=A0A6I6JER9_9BACT|nr:hypothetical protein [Pseudodesulfovibrio cashew]QGY38912.1 hypothetical protein GM415_01750 [Pseudodesulfovibrio cashew]